MASHEPPSVSTNRRLRRASSKLAHRGNQVGGAVGMISICISQIISLISRRTFDICIAIDNSEQVV
jgi:hypothetical protein